MADWPASIGSIGSLPRPPPTLIGREREVAAVSALLGRDDVRLVTLTGPGGVGKTRLAIETARLIADEYSDRVRFISVSLEPLDWLQAGSHAAAN